MNVRRVGPDVAHLPLWPTTEVSTPAQVAGSLGLERARQEEREAKERGYRVGFEKGLTEGKREAGKEAASLAERMDKELKQSQAKLESSRERLGDLFDSLSKALEEHALLAETAAVEAAYAAVARFLGETYADRSVMEALCRHALARSGHAAVAVRVSEADVDALSGIDSVAIIGDSRLLPGQCTLETGMGHYETGLDIRMDLIKQALLAGLAEHRSGAKSE